MSHYESGWGGSAMGAAEVSDRHRAPQRPGWAISWLDVRLQMKDMAHGRWLYRKTLEHETGAFRGASPGSRSRRVACGIFYAQCLPAGHLSDKRIDGTLEIGGVNRKPRLGRVLTTPSPDLTRKPRPRRDSTRATPTEGPQGPWKWSLPWIRCPRLPSSRPWSRRS